MFFSSCLDPLPTDNAICGAMVGVWMEISLLKGQRTVKTEDCVELNRIEPWGSPLSCSSLAPAVRYQIINTNTLTHYQQDMTLNHIKRHLFLCSVISTMFIILYVVCPRKHRALLRKLLVWSC